MQSHCHLRGFVVAATKDDGQGNLLLVHQTNGKPVSFQHIFCTQSHLSETVIHMNVHTGNKNGEFRLKAIDGKFKALFNPL